MTTPITPTLQELRQEESRQEQAQQAGRAAVAPTLEELVLQREKARPLRVANASGFYGDRFSAVAEMLADGPIDVLTGDYLAELTMLILGRDRMRDPSTGYAKTFLRQLEGSLGTALDRGVTIVANAGGLNPCGLAAKLRELADRLGLHPRIAFVRGDDLLDRVGEFGLGSPITANAYLGAWGIVECLNAGADIVVTGRVTDASLVVGPAAAHFGWSRDDFDALAGATVAGHIIECGAQATGGNYAFFTEQTRGRPGFPIAEVRADGSCVVTKHVGTGGAVTLGTVTAQLLYEIGGPRYAGPDVTTRLDTVVLADDGPDRVLVSGVIGEPPPPTLKVGLNTLGGYRNEVAFILTGLDIEAKAAWVTAELDAALAGRRPAAVHYALARTDHADAGTQEAASALLRITVKDPDPAVVGRAFSSAAVELALASYPGCTVTAPPGEGTPFGVFAAAFVDAGAVAQEAVLPDRSVVPVAHGGRTRLVVDLEEPVVAGFQGGGPTRRAPLGLVAGARSGDKGGSANIGLWVRSDAAYAWLCRTLTTDELRRLLPEAAALPITRHLLPNLRGINFVVDGLLGDGVSAGVRFDPQGKGLGEWLRSRHVDIPEEFL
ncbi:hypothetical protein F4553_006689 [Allocatelliglobosispora scoriae]|uniref:DUF1446 domain-containing protein n=2 Tax=Allocatelliglobosispora scoriae TaxID=643052 RepID=A0A841BZZ1_9ACTN|nr:acyclic terpene utilization AtuA family protein [Allocatelliglobosispora scoriae]MBB5873255.1 hypothetical protein [Allocatelliglobosispora scoriae]